MADEVKAPVEQGKPAQQQTVRYEKPPEGSKRHDLSAAHNAAHERHQEAYKADNETAVVAAKNMNKVLEQVAGTSDAPAELTANVEEPAAEQADYEISGQDEESQPGESEVARQLRIMVNDNELTQEQIEELNRKVQLAQIVESAYQGNKEAIEYLQKQILKQEKAEAKAKDVIPDEMLTETQLLQKRLDALEQRDKDREAKTAREREYSDVKGKLDAYKKKYKTADMDPELLGMIEYQAVAQSHIHGGIEAAYKKYANAITGMARKATSQYAKDKVQNSKNRMEGPGGPAPTSKANVKVALADVKNLIADKFRNGEYARGE